MQDMVESEKAIMLYNKYRPRTFDDAVGQEHITDVMKGLLLREQYKILNSVLLVGNAGGGKTTLSRVFAKAINCLERKPDGSPCDKCSHCIQFDNKIYPDFIEIDGASYNKVEDAKFLIDLANRFPQVRGHYRVMLIDEAHRMSNSAWDLFLKLLEEGENKTIFLFATTEPHNVRGAIISRSFIFQVSPLTANEIYKLLVKICKSEGIEYDKASLHTIAKANIGKTRDAIKTMDMYWKAYGRIENVHIDVLENRIIEALISAFMGSLDEARKIVDALLKYEFNIKETIAKALFSINSMGYVSDIVADVDLVEKAKSTFNNLLPDITQEFLIYKPDTLETFKLFLALVSSKGIGLKELGTTKNAKRRVRGTENETTPVVVKEKDDTVKQIKGKPNKADKLKSMGFTEIGEV